MNFIDLFAGAGGLSEGFIQAGFAALAHVEMDKAACFTLMTRTAFHYLQKNNQDDLYTRYLKGHVSRQELYSYVPGEILNGIISLPISGEFNPSIHRRIKQQVSNKEIDIVIGGPPCQAYSLVGRARSSNQMSGDPRNYLYIHYARYLALYKPKLFVFENVMGLKSAKGGLYLKNMERLFLEKGYEIDVFALEANNFGVLQNRKRIIIVGKRNDFSDKLPDLGKISILPEGKVQSIFSDLPFLHAGQGQDKYQKYTAGSNAYLTAAQIRNGVDVLTQHVARPHTLQDKEIYKLVVKKWDLEGKRLDYNDLPIHLKTHKNRHSFFDRFKVVAQDLNFSQTVVAHIAKDGHYYIHPDVSQNRSITIREAARLQSFPDNYYFEGVKEKANRTAAFKQIGNAVPPRMAYFIALELKKYLNG